MPAEPTLGTALARLESRWGSAAVRVGMGATRPQVDGALALEVAPAQPAEAVASLPDEVVPTGFARLDALLGTGGLPRGVSASFRGARVERQDRHSRCTASPRRRRAARSSPSSTCAASSIRSRRSARGVDLRWLLVLRPARRGRGLGARRGARLRPPDRPARGRPAGAAARRPMTRRCAVWRPMRGGRACA